MMMNLFDPAAAAQKRTVAGLKRTANAKIKEWVMEALGVENRGKVQTVSVQEFACGDPNCSPFDTAITLHLRTGENLNQSIPQEMHEVTKPLVEDAVDMMLNPGETPMGNAQPMSEAAAQIFTTTQNYLFDAMDKLPLQQRLIVCENLLEAVDNYQYTLMKQLQDRAKANQTGNAILSCAQKNDVAGLQRTIEEGTDPSFANSVGQTALHVAVLWGNVEATEFLIGQGADVNRRNQLGESTPLHTLAQSPKPVEGRIACAHLLLQAGSDLKAKDGRNLTAAEVAAEQNCQEMVELLTKAAAAGANATNATDGTAKGGFDISKAEVVN